MRPLTLVLSCLTVFLALPAPILAQSRYERGEPTVVHFRDGTTRLRAGESTGYGRMLARVNRGRVPEARLNETAFDAANQCGVIYVCSSGGRQETFRNGSCPRWNGTDQPIEWATFCPNGHRERWIVDRRPYFMPALPPTLVERPMAALVAQMSERLQGQTSLSQREYDSWLERVTALPWTMPSASAADIANLRAVMIDARSRLGATTAPSVPEPAATAAPPAEHPTAPTVVPPTAASRTTKWYAETWLYIVLFVLLAGLAIFVIAWRIQVIMKRRYESSAEVLTSLEKVWDEKTRGPLLPESFAALLQSAGQYFVFLAGWQRVFPMWAFSPESFSLLKVALDKSETENGEWKAKNEALNQRLVTERNRPPVVLPGSTVQVQDKGLIDEVKARRALERTLHEAFTGLVPRIHALAKGVSALADDGDDLGARGRTPRSMKEREDATNAKLAELLSITAVLAVAFGSFEQALQSLALARSLGYLNPRADQRPWLTLLRTDVQLVLQAEIRRLRTERRALNAAPSLPPPPPPAPQQAEPSRKNTLRYVPVQGSNGGPEMGPDPFPASPSVLRPTRLPGDLEDADPDAAVVKT